MTDEQQDIERLARRNPAPLDRVEAETDTAARERARETFISRAATLPPDRSRRTARTLRIAALATAGACLLLAFGLVRGGEEPSTGTSFGSFAAIAAEQPVEGIRFVSWESRLLYDRPESWGGHGRFPGQIEDTTEVSLWIGDGQRFEQDVHRFWDRRENVTRGTFLTDLPAGIMCWGGFGDGRMCTRSSLLAEFGDPAERLDLPLEPEALRAALEERARDDGSDARLPPCGLDGEEFGMPVPYSMVGGSDRSTLLTDLRAAAGLRESSSGWTYRAPPGERLFTTITTLLADPEASPELRAALFEVLGDIDGARIAPDGQDRLGREAAVIEYEAPPDERFAHDEIFVDPETSEVLEQRTTVEERRGPGEPEVLGTYYRLFTERGQVSELPPAAAPYEADMAAAKQACSEA